MTAFFARPSSGGNARPHSVPDSEADEKKRSSESTNKSGKVFAMLAIKLTRHAKYGIIIWYCGDDDPQCEPTVQKYPSGSRGSPAKGVVRETVARVQIPPSAPALKPVAPCDGLLLFAASGTPQKPFAGNGLSRSESEIAEIT